MSLDRSRHRVAAEFLVELVHAAMRQLAGGDLRTHVAHRGIRKADVVANDLEQNLDRLAGVVDLQLVELQPFHPWIDHLGAAAETRTDAADIDPMRAYHREHEQLAPKKIGHVDDDVVEMLARDRLVVGDDDVVGLEARGAVPLHAVDDERAEIGHEMRYPADILRHQAGIGEEHRGAEVAHLVDHHVIRGPMQIRRHFGGDGRKRAANHFERHGIELVRHAAFPTVMISSPVSATARLSPGKMTVVEAYSLTSAGPAILSPGFNFSRS